MKPEYLKYQEPLKRYIVKHLKPASSPLFPNLQKIFHGGLSGHSTGTLLPDGTGPAVAGDPVGSLLSTFLSHRQESFHGCLFRMIDVKHLKASDVYKKAGISRQLFSKIRCNEDYEPEKSTILALAVGMKLNINETNKLLACAGLMLSDSSVQDLIVRFFIERGEYDLDIYNSYLDLHGQPLLGSS